MKQNAGILAALSTLSSFDFYSSPEFWLAFLVVVVVTRLVKRSSIGAPWVMLVTSLLMLLALPRLSFVGVGFLLMLSFFVFAIGRVLSSSRGPQAQTGRNWIAAGAVAVILVVLVFAKYRFVQELVLRNAGVADLTGGDYLSIVGISYTSFRMIHFVLEARKGTLERLELVTFLNYVFFFASFISGPIQRYNHFADQWHAASHPGVADDLGRGAVRIVHGVFKKIVLSVLVAPYGLPQAVASGNLAPLRVVLGIYASTLYFYLDFSGYSDIAIGTARVLGIELPENFKKPFARSNIQQLWANWHISLTSWLTDYVYWPLARKLRRIGPLQRRPMLLSNICIVATFALCGIWHGVTLNFFLWGLYHGFGIAVMNVYRSYKRKVRSPLIREYFVSKASRLVGVFATCNYFAFGIVLFSLNFDGIRLLLSTT